MIHLWDLDFACKAGTDSQGNIWIKGRSEQTVDSFGNKIADHGWVWVSVPNTVELESLIVATDQVTIHATEAMVKRQLLNAARQELL